MRTQKKKGKNCSKDGEYSLSELLYMVKEAAIKEDIKSITSAADVYAELIDFADKKQEYFLCITLDGASKIINTRTLFIGTINQSLVHPREVFVDAISDRAVGIIIAHTHPSGTLEPSRADVQITQRLKEVGVLVGIELLDHVILASSGYYSFSDEGML